jgi:carbon monoxide dehydrogenase subunit G
VAWDDPAVPDSYTVTRQAHVVATPDEVFAHLADFRRWRAWSPFEELDPGMQRSYTGEGRGSTYAWSGSLKAGTGRMEIVELEPGRRVVVEQENTKPLRSRSTSTFTLTPAAAGTTVEWSGTGRLNRLMRVMGALMPMERVLGPAFEQGLIRLGEAARPAR